MVIRESLAHDLPEPAFAQRDGEFTTFLWRDWLTDKVIAELGLYERQAKAVTFVKAHQQISNSICQSELEVSKPTSSRDLEDLIKKGVLERVGTTGKGTYYVLGRKGLTKGSNGSLHDLPQRGRILAKGATKGPKGPLAFQELAVHWNGS